MKYVVEPKGIAELAFCNGVCKKSGSTCTTKTVTVVTNKKCKPAPAPSCPNSKNLR